MAEAVAGGRGYPVAAGGMVETTRRPRRRAVAASESLGVTHDASADVILRFRRSERIVHWAIAAPFMVCWLTAIVLVVVYNPHPRLPLRAVFSWMHRVSGVCLITLPLLTAVLFKEDLRLHRRNVGEAWRWSFDDVKWLALQGPATLFKKIVLPEQGKFNAGEKLNFMVVTLTWPLYGLTGLMIWLPGVAFFSWIAHVAMAMVATPFLLGHIFMATANPDTRVGLAGMISGYVDRHWARHHYGKWYREHFGDHRPGAGHDAPGIPDAPGLAASPAAPVPLPIEILCPSCGTSRMIASPSMLVDEVLRGATLECGTCGAPIDQVAANVEDADLEVVLALLAQGGSVVSRAAARAESQP